MKSNQKTTNIDGTHQLYKFTCSAICQHNPRYASGIKRVTCAVNGDVSDATYGSTPLQPAKPRTIQNVLRIDALAALAALAALTRMRDICFCASRKT